MLNSPLVDKLIDLAIEEDLSFGDITSELTVPAATKGKAVILARERLIVCGLPLVERILSRAGRALKFEALAKEGSLAKAQQPICRLKGKARDILALERTILNFLQRMSGVAGAAAAAQKAAGNLCVLDTRKTTPGWRVLEKYAVRVGGATNHRFSLGDMILVKNNHIDACNGDIQATLRPIFKARPRYMPVEVEVRDINELKATLKFPVDVVMLDNFSDLKIVPALALVNSKTKRPLVEVSGGITESRLTQLQKLGVDCVSMGALTTKATNCDISLRLTLVK
jgi:nicotinate-nucleotide pyrophosphorylase (carboxylating)